MNADGSVAIPLTKLTAGGVQTINPEWSPAGTKILFTSERALDGSDAVNTNSIFNIWVMDADGSSASALTKLSAPGTRSINPNQVSRNSEIID
jgi:Tol biopolymer transport system component